MENLYKPIIVKKDVDNEHFYYVDDVFMPSVTKLLGETMPTPFALRQWIGEVGNEKAQEKLERAGDRGTKIHDACERLLRGEEVNLAEEFKDKKDKKCIASFINWVNECNPILLPNWTPEIREKAGVTDEQYQLLTNLFGDGIEFVVASRLGYAGTGDLLCIINNNVYIVDFKTSASVYDSHFLQITGYQGAVTEMVGIMARRAILHLNPKTIKGYNFIEKIEIGKKDVTIDDFHLVLDMYKMLNGGVIPEPKLQDIYPDVVTLYASSKKQSTS